MATNYGLLGSLLYEVQKAPPKRRCFISYHHADEDEVRDFLDTYSNWEVFTHRALGLEMEPDVINSMDTDYVMRRIRELYMQNTSVTIVMVGRNTWGRRYVDWEIAASLRNAMYAPANGLLGIKLPSFRAGDLYPDRLNDNLNPPDAPPGTECYARCIPYPTNAAALQGAIEDAYQRRETHAYLIRNARARFVYNRS